MINIKTKIKFENVTCQYIDSKDNILENISFELEPNSINAILGSGGSGKTTICNLISGIIPKIQEANVKGYISINGKNIDNCNLSELSLIVGKVAQEPESMFCNLYVKDEVAFGLENLCIEPKIIKQKVNQILDQVGLSGLSNRKITNLSGGQIQRLALACILVMEPDIIILDEPTANIDPEGVNELFKILLKLKQKGKTIIITSKEWHEHISNCDQLIILENRTLFLVGKPNNILNIQGYDLLRLNIFIPQVSEILIKMNLKDVKICSTVQETYDILNEKSVIFKNELIDYTKDKSLNKLVYTFKDLEYTYPNGTQAINKLNFNIYSNLLTTIVGQNGAGKSTLAKLMVGLLKPTSGSVFLNGNSISTKGIHSKVGFVFQNPEHQFITDSVYEELSYSLKIKSLDECIIKEKVEAALNTFKLTADKTKHPLLLNAGQKRRLAVASVLISEPEVIIIDEPTYGQDKYMTNVLMNILRDLVNKEISIIMITHDMRIVQEYSDYVYVMSNGNLIFEDEFSKLFFNNNILKEADLVPPQLYRLISLFLDDDVKMMKLPRTVDEFLNYELSK